MDDAKGDSDSDQEGFDIPDEAVDAYFEAFDTHGEEVDDQFHVSKLYPKKKYKVAGVEFVDKEIEQPVDANDPLYELINEFVTFYSAEIVTKAQLESVEKDLRDSGFLWSVKMDGVTQADGSLEVQVSVVENQWLPADSCRCVNVGLICQSRWPKDEASMTNQQPKEICKEMMEKIAGFTSSAHARISILCNKLIPGAIVEEEEYEARLRRARPCMLPEDVEREISGWIRTETTVTPRMLQRMRNRVQRWYHDERYACAQVVRFGSLNADEVILEVVEGDITKLQIEILDKMDSPCECVAKLPIERELQEHLGPGQVFKTEAATKAMESVNRIGLFSHVQVDTMPDEESDGGFVVEVTLRLKDLEQ